MARNEVMVHIDDRQIADLKKSMRQIQLKNESETDKIRKAIDQVSHRLNEVVRYLDEMKLEPAIKKEDSDVDD